MSDTILAALLGVAASAFGLWSKRSAAAMRAEGFGGGRDVSEESAEERGRSWRAFQLELLSFTLYAQARWIGYVLCLIAVVRIVG